MKTAKKILLVIIILTFVSGCRKQEKKDSGASPLELKSTYSLSIPEPSGLCFTSEGDGLWTVSDHTGNIYRITFEGKVTKEFDIDASDNEGICLYGEDKMAVVLERPSEIRLVDNEGKVILRKESEISGARNYGMEGITYNEKNNHFYILQEKEPTLIETDGEFNILNKKRLDFSSDISGIFYEADEDVLWMVSDESKLVAKCDLEGKPIKKYKIDVVQAEGIAVNPDENLIYLVSDRKSELYVYQLRNDK